MKKKHLLHTTIAAVILVVLFHEPSNPEGKPPEPSNSINALRRRMSFPKTSSVSHHPFAKEEIIDISAWHW